MLKYWDKVNWHTIISKLWNKFTIRCWTCWILTKKWNQWLHLNDRCKKCQDKVTLHYAWRSIMQWCYILWLNEHTIRNRIKRWWTIKEALFLDRRVLYESLSDKDLIYLAKYNETTHDQMKALEDNAYKNYLHNKRNNVMKII